MRSDSFTNKGEALARIDTYRAAIGSSNSAGVTCCSRRRAVSVFPLFFRDASVHSEHPAGRIACRERIFQIPVYLCFDSILARRTGRRLFRSLLILRFAFHLSTSILNMTTKCASTTKSDDDVAVINHVESAAYITHLIRPDGTRASAKSRWRMNLFLAHLLLLTSLGVNAYPERVERAYTLPKILRRYPSTFTTSYVLLLRKRGKC
jgi:hypothetical protein